MQLGEASTANSIRGVSRLALDAVEQVTTIVEGMHANIAAAPLPFGKGTDGRARGIAGLVYGSIRLVNGAVRATLDSALQWVVSPTAPQERRDRREILLAVLNGVLGDHLAASANPLAIAMSFRRRGKPLSLEPASLSAAFPDATKKLLVQVHALCMSDVQWTRNGHNHGDRLATDLGYTPVVLRYNSGRHISENGRELAEMLEKLLEAWPTTVEELVVVAHSLGGLVVRSAHHYGTESKHRWPERLRKLVFLGTPHHGAPLERGGNRLQALVGASPYTAPLSRLGMIRSAGVTDLRYGNLLDEDWQHVDRFHPGGDQRRLLPLPDGVACYAAAATLGRSRGDLKDRWLGDGLVPVSSALGRHRDPRKTLRFPESHRFVGYGMNHFDLLDRPEIYAKLVEWLRS